MILFIFRESGKEEERGRDTSMCERHIHGLPLALKSRQMLQQGIEPVTLWFPGWCSIH